MPPESVDGGSAAHHIDAKFWLTSSQMNTLHRGDAPIDAPEAQHAYSTRDKPYHRLTP